jgi:hypothetical protein
MSAAHAPKRFLRLTVACLSVAFVASAVTDTARARPSVLESRAGFRLSGNYTNTQTIPDLQTALQIARSHSMLVISQGWQLGVDGSWDGTVEDTYWGEMMATNPRLLIFRYLNAIYDLGADFPESWYLHNAAGHRLFNPVYRTFLMDPRSVEPRTKHGVTSYGWIDYLVHWYRKDVARNPGVFNGGIWLDDVAGKPHVIDVTTGQPSHPVDHKGRPWSDEAWSALTTSVSARLRDATQQLVFGNALMTGHCYFTGCGGRVPTRFFASAPSLDGVMAEGWLTMWFKSTATMPSFEGWRLDLQMVIDANRRGRTVQLMTAPPAIANAADVAKWRLYAYASFLLANGGRSYFQFAPNCRPSCGGAKHTPNFEMAHPLYSFAIGSPRKTAGSVRAYAKRGGRYYVRPYSNGKVFVNPTKRPVYVWLGRRHLLPDGRVVRGLFLPATSGQITIALPRQRQPDARARERAQRDPIARLWRLVSHS